MTSTDFLDQTPQQINKTSLPGRIVLVMQGGGAPGCYQGGAYQALHEAGIEPDWVIGTSIGAIIAGNEVNSRLERLRVFWEKLDTCLPEPVNQLANSPRVKELASWSCTTTMHLVEINAQPIEGETNARDYDFSRAAVQARWRAGYADTCRMLERRPWNEPIDPATEVTLYQSDAPAREQQILQPEERYRITRTSYPDHTQSSEACQPKRLAKPSKNGDENDWFCFKGNSARCVRQKFVLLSQSLPCWPA